VSKPTFFGGTIAIADFGVIEMCWGFGSLSPFSERLIAYPLSQYCALRGEVSIPIAGQPTFISAT
jgi:hypothetical protein